MSMVSSLLQGHRRNDSLGGMKHPRSLLCCLYGLAFLAFTLPHLSAQTATETIGKIYLEGQNAYAEGDTTVARARFEEVLQLNPKHPGAKNYLKLIMEMERSGDGGAAMQKLMTQTLIAVDFTESSLESVLQFLPQLAEKESGGKLKASIVVRLDEATLQKRVTLKLSNTPYSEVLRYIGDMTGVMFRPEKYAIVALPAGVKAAPGGATAPAATANPTPLAPPVGAFPDGADAL